MQCAFCGFAQPGLEPCCPSCGRTFKSGPVVVPKAKPVAVKRVVRAAIYSAVVFGLIGSFQHLCASYLDAEQERAESMLMQQLLEQKSRARAAAQELDQAGEETATDLPSPAPRP